MNLKHHQFLNTFEEILVKPDFNNQKTKSNTVSISEIQETLGIARGTVYQAFKKNHIPHLRVSHRIIVPRDLWNDYLNRYPRNFHNGKTSFKKNVFGVNRGIKNDSRKY